ncbi:type VI secretion system baseplate subunit TssG [Teichococcus wenyumeiae]|nr:type VI secretion system baseplate subunit TssG [Pseudoroseomonas wenyumeiae]
MAGGVQALFEALAAEPEAFDLFQVLRRIDAQCPDRPRLGESAHPAQDAVRIGQQPAMAFAPRAIAALELAEPDGPARLLSYGFGMFGPNGPLPMHLTEYAFSRMHHAGDPTLARFADMFHHRMASLFFRAWAESEPTVSHDRPGEDRFATQLGALAGFGMASLRGRDGMPDLAKLHFTGRLAAHARNAEGLEAILGDFFSAPVRIREFAPQWIRLPQEALCQLGRNPENGRLGSTAMAGVRLKVHHHRFRVVAGPLSLAAYERLLPGAPGLFLLGQISRNYLGDELAWEANLVLHRDEVPPLQLGRAGRLGWTGWLGRRRAPGHADDLVTTPPETPPHAGNARANTSWSTP